MTFSGTVKAFQADKGFGFITTDDGLDLFVHSKACTDGKTLQAGDKVMFDLEDSKTKPGEYVAGNVSGGTGSPGGGGGAWGGGGGSWGAAPKGGGGGASWGGAAAGTGQYTGTVKTFTPDKGFGFVAASDGTDYFFHQKQFVDGSAPAQGDFLTFDLEASPLKPGQFQGCNITGGSQQGPPQKGKGKGKGKDGGKGKGKDSGKGKSKDGGKGKGKDDGKSGPRLTGKKHQMCTHFPLGTCRKMDMCTFAHSEAEVGTSYDHSGGAGGYGAAPKGGGKSAAGPYGAWGGAGGGW